MRDDSDDFRVRAADDPASMLVVILDVGIASWVDVAGKQSSDATEQAVAALQSVAEQLLVFLNTFLLLHEANRVFVILAGGHGAKLVYPVFPDPESVSTDDDVQIEDASFDAGASESSRLRHIVDSELTVRELRDAVRDGLLQSIHAQDDVNIGSRPTPVSTALASALCLHNRMGRIKTARAALNTGTNVDQVDVDQAPPSNGRIFTLLASRDAPEQYVPVMNCIFSAQHIGVPIDSCVLSREGDSTYLQQAAHLTQGVYLRPESFSTSQPDSLLQILQTVFLVDRQNRNFLAMPAPEKVDFRASCLITRKTIEEGYTCSVCLSTFDLSVGKRAAMCPICGARFAIAARPRARPPRPN